MCNSVEEETTKDEIKVLNEVAAFHSLAADDIDWSRFQSYAPPACGVGCKVSQWSGSSSNPTQGAFSTQPHRQSLWSDSQLMKKVNSKQSRPLSSEKNNDIQIMLAEKIRKKLETIAT